MTEFEREAFLSQVDRVRTDIREKFSKTHQFLNEREYVLSSELDQLVSSYGRVEVREEIQQLSASKEVIMSALKGKENYKALELSIAPLNARIRELEVKLESTDSEMRRAELEWDDELESRLNEIGRIRIIRQFESLEKEELVKTTFNASGNKSQISFPSTRPQNISIFCITCGQNVPNTCIKCKRINVDPVSKWCQNCYEEDVTKFQRCGKGERCPSCGSKKFYDMQVEKFFDFCGQTCAAQHYRKFGMLELEPEHGDYQIVDSKFREKWSDRKGTCPPITAIFKICPQGAEEKLAAYMKTLRHANSEFIEYYFHGCKITCDLLKNKSLCDRADCTICLVSKQGFDISKVGSNCRFTRFGKSLTFAPESSKCHDYTMGVKDYGYRAMFYVKCAPGFKQIKTQDNLNRTEPDRGYDSVYGLAGASLNYDEICFYNDSACVPEYIIIYCKDGVDKRCF